MRAKAASLERQASFVEAEERLLAKELARLDFKGKGATALRSRVATYRADLRAAASALQHAAGTLRSEASKLAAAQLEARNYNAVMRQRALDHATRGH